MTVTDLPVLSVKLYKLFCPSSVIPGAPTPEPTDIWFPVPDTIVTLPDVPDVVVNPVVIPGNSADPGGCFDPDAPDLSQIFNNLLPTEETPGTGDVELNIGTLVPIDNELIPLQATLRLFAGVKNYTYDLIPKVTNVRVNTRTPAIVQDLKAKLATEARAFNLQGHSALLLKTERHNPGVFTLVGWDAELTRSYLTSRTLLADVGVFRLNPNKQTLILSHFDTDFSDEAGLSYGWSYYRNWTFYAPSVVPSPKKLGTGALNLYDSYTAYLYAYIPESVIGLDAPDFTMEVFVYVISSFDYCRVFSLGDQTGSYGYSVIYYNERIQIYQIVAGTTSTEKIFESDAVAPAGAWNHIVLEQANDGLRVYANGVVLYNNQFPYVGYVFDVGERLDLRNAIFIGAYSDVPGDAQSDETVGYFDEFRLVKGAVYRGGLYGVPTQQYDVAIPGSGVIDLRKVQIFNAASGSFTYSGQGISFARPTNIFRPFAGLFGLTGEDASLYKTNTVLSSATGQFSITLAPTTGISLVGSVTGSGGSMALNWPAGASIGDFGILIVESSAAVEGFKSVYPPYGWAVVPGSPTKNEVDLVTPAYLDVFYRRVSSLGVAAELPVPANHQVAILAVFRGVDADSPFVDIATLEAPAGTTLTFPVLTERIPSTVILDLLAGGTDSATLPALTARANSAPRWDDAGLVNSAATTSSDGGFVAAYYSRTKWEGLGLLSTTATSNKTTHLLMTLALRPRGWSEPIEALAGDAGSIALNGQSAGLAKGYVAQTLRGVFDLAGQIATFVYGEIIAGAAGVVSLAGQDTGFSYARRLTGSPGAFALSGVSAQLSRALTLGAETTAYTLTGQSALLGRPPVAITADAGICTLAGQVAAFALALNVLAEAVSYAATGQDAAFSLGGGTIDGGDATSTLVDSYDGGDATSSLVDIVDGGAA